MNTLKNNKGVTLVEIIVGVVIFALASISLVMGFVSSANIITRATFYKNASASASSSIELQLKEESEDTDIQTVLTSGAQPITIEGVRSDNGRTVVTEVDGAIFMAQAGMGDSILKYREFVPGDRAYLDVD